MKKLLGWTLVGFVVLAAVGYLLRRPITMAVMPGVVAGNMGSSLLDELPDGLHIAFCGAGSPMPDPERSGPCVAIIAGDRVFVVDSGSGSARNLAWMRIPSARIDGVLLTHFHSDHIDGLGELLLQRWVGRGSAVPTPIYGPLGVERIVNGFKEAYAQDVEARVAHHGESIVPRSGAGGRAYPFGVPADGEAIEIVREGDLLITSFAVDHEPVRPAVGYRFDYKGRSVLISGDTSKSSNLEKFARGVDVLAHEALAPQLVALMTEGAQRAGRPNMEKITVDILDYHASPVEAAETARDAGVGELVFYHIVPPLLLATMEEIFVEGVAEIYPGPVTIARDGTLISLPADSDRIDQDELL